MPKKIVKRCIRPQCMKIYDEIEKNRFCMCGALLQKVEIDTKSKKHTYKNFKLTESKARLYLLLDNKEVEFQLSNITRIGRGADGVQVDIDLSEYAGKDVSREHAIIRREKDGYYITNVSRNHSVRIIGEDDNAVALEYGKKVLLKSEYGILLSKKVLLQFVEEE